MTTNALLKRAYEEPDSADGFRVFVDRLLPRGKKNAAQKHSTMTLNYGAKDTDHNKAVILLPSFKRAVSHVAKE